MHNDTANCSRMSRRTCFLIATGQRSGSSAQEFRYRAITEVELIRKPQVGYGRKCDHRSHRHRFGCEAESEMPAGGVADHDRRLTEVICRSFDARDHIFECAGPAAAGLSHAAVLKFRRCKTMSC